MLLKNKQLRQEYQQLLFPLLIEQIFMMLIGNVNVFLLSLYNDQAVAAAGLSDQVLAIGTMAMGIVSLGSTVLFLQNADEAQIKQVQSISRMTIILNVIVSLILVSITLLLGHTIMNWMQTPQELHGMATLYLRIVSISLLFQGISTSASALLRSFGLVNRAMRISILNTLIIIAGNAIVILTPLSIFGEGLLGISVATVVTRFIGAIISAFAIYTELPQVWEGLLNFKPQDTIVMKRILSLGIPSGMENVSYNLSQTVITAVIASLGAQAVSGKIYAQTITAIVFTLSVAGGQAAQIMIGRYIREKKIKEARQFGVENTVLFVGVGLVINVIIALLGPWIIQIFTTDPIIMRIVQSLLWLNCLYDPLRVANETLIASLNVTGDVRYPVIIGILVTYIFTVPASLLVGGYLGWGIQVIWLIFILDEGLRAFLFYRRWQQGDWAQLYLSLGDD